MAGRGTASRVAYTNKTTTRASAPAGARSKRTSGARKTLRWGDDGSIRAILLNRAWIDQPNERACAEQAPGSPIVDAAGRSGDDWPGAYTSYVLTIIRYGIAVVHAIHLLSYANHGTWGHNATPGSAVVLGRCRDTAVRRSSRNVHSNAYSCRVAPWRNADCATLTDESPCCRRNLPWGRGNAPPPIRPTTAPARTCPSIPASAQRARTWHVLVVVRLPWHASRRRSPSLPPRTRRGASGMASDHPGVRAG